MKKIIYGILAVAPVFAFAQSNLSGVQTLVSSFGRIVTSVIPIIFALAIVYFFWGLVKYIQAAGDPKKADEGKSIMIYGVIAIAVMVSVYGLVQWLQTALGVANIQTLPLPTVNIP